MGDSKRIELPPMKKVDDYDNWKFLLKASICAHPSVNNPVEVLAFLEVVEDLSVSDTHLFTEREEIFAKLDTQLFLALVMALNNSVDGSQITTRIRGSVTFGCGRQALRLVDKFYRHEKGKARTRALRNLMQLSCDKVSRLGDYLARFSLYESDAGVIDEGMKIELLKNSLLQFSQLDAVFAVWQKNLGSAEELFQDLEAFTAERRDTQKHQHQDQKPPPHGGGKKKGRGHKAHLAQEGVDRDTCHWCGKKGHWIADCYAYQRAIDAGEVEAPQTGKQKGKGGKGAKGGKAKGKGGAKGGKGKGKGGKKGAHAAAEAYYDCYSQWDWDAEYGTAGVDQQVAGSSVEQKDLSGIVTAMVMKKLQSDAGTASSVFP